MKPSCIGHKDRAMLGVPRVVYPCGHLLRLNLESCTSWRQSQVFHELGLGTGDSRSGVSTTTSVRGRCSEGLRRGVDTGVPEAGSPEGASSVLYIAECVLAACKVLLFYTLGTQCKPHRPSLSLRDVQWKRQTLGLLP